MSEFEDHTLTVDPDVLNPLIAAVRDDATQLDSVGDVQLPDTRFCNALIQALARYDEASAALYTEAESIAESVEAMMADAEEADHATAAEFERIQP